ncbi:MAG: Indolepyruvate ferredoxin oxidoreductase, alpha and beta subunits [uncultured Sulfurovum sp.]|uniref:Indolepyruvate ferredoxin oxidoreductase, alpha and beta subunits n=1 Tax=uncultured Sulfurovum sp. TaxID=269237 RepID=A0A6S6T1J7_9BACT|nr:MAG: Indolepyruvate ferredoxin oxidoreductase, alpha and beta subunits [uncultured Sulfurovum sp.]
MALDTNKFVDGLIDNGYSHLCVVPCSFAKNVINAAINNDSIEYVPCASEAVACSIAAGLKMAGSKPIVIVQSSGVTNMGSCMTSLLNPYSLTFPIITSWRTYKAGNSEIQHKHLATELPTLIASYGYEHIVIDQDSIDTAIVQINTCDTSKTVSVLKKDTFTKVELEEKHKLDLSGYTPRSEFLMKMNEMCKKTDTLFIGTTGNTAREMYSFMPDTNNFYMAGNMGGALSLGLGAALAGKKVVVCGGDAEFVMHMGGMTTAGRYKDISLTYLLFDNESNKSTGGQNTYQSHVNYIGIAKSSNLDCIDEIVTDLSEFSTTFETIQKTTGLKFLCVKCGVDEETPRPPLNVVKASEF